ncbi:conserved hypothetical protein [Rhodobacteraceae bacterium KLH11]|nr:conserved hypothetical protein [Rhodobacteraceae bacterium KLH11]
MATTSGSGAAVAQLEGGDVTTDGDNAHGLWAEIINAESAADARAHMTGGDVTTGGDNAHGLFATTSGSGAATARMADGRVTTDGEYDIVDADVRAWVEAARSNPAQYRDRQVTEIVLAAIGLAPSLNTNLVLKGGAVMALAFKSNRVTADVDFTSIVEPAGFADQIADDLNAILPQTAIRLGYLGLLCRVQTVKKMPKPLNFEEFDFPALLIRIGSAERGTGEEKRLEAGRAIRVLDIEISGACLPRVSVVRVFGTRSSVN